MLMVMFSPSTFHGWAPACPIRAAIRRPAAPGLPDLGGERLIVVGGTGQIGDVGAGGTDLLGGLVVVVPGLDGLAVHAGLVEHCLVVEEHFGAGINRQSVRLVVVLELVPRAGGEVVGEFVGAEFAQVHEAIGDGELGDGRIFEHHDVRGAVACGDGVGERGGGLLGGAGVVELDGDAGVGLLEVSEDFLHRVAGIPAPEHEFGLVSVTLVGAVVVAAARPTSVATAAVAAMTFLVLRMLSPSGPLELTCGWLAFFRLASGFRPVTSRLSSGCLWLPSDC